MSEPRRVVGTESDVRIDAQVYGDRLGPSVNVPLKYDITNNRQTTILVADLLPESTYDPDTHTIYVYSKSVVEALGAAYVGTPAWRGLRRPQHQEPLRVDAGSSFARAVVVRREGDPRPGKNSAMRIARVVSRGTE